MRCVNCNKNISDKNKNGRIQKFCNRKCYLQYSTIYTKSKICLLCGNEYKQNECRNKSNFRKQKFCSLECRLKALNNGLKFESIDYAYNLIF